VIRLNIKSIFFVCFDDEEEQARSIRSVQGREREERKRGKKKDKLCFFPSD
jgi:hypothetical protein